MGRAGAYLYPKMAWKRSHLELDRKRLGLVKARVSEADDAWPELRRLLKVSVGKSLLGDDMGAQDPVNYEGLRDEWLRRWHGLQQAIESLYTDSEQVPYDELWAIHRCFRDPSLSSAVTFIRKYGGDEKIETATFIPAEDFWIQIAGRLRDLDKQMPSRRAEVLSWVGSRPDWVERTLGPSGWS